MEAAIYSETSATVRQSAWRHIPEGCKVTFFML
jgi:hypothetical protein